MEWKIGEIKQVNGEWYQCVVAIQGCRECSFRTQDYCTRHSECLSVVRSDGMSVIFKKLEKVGEPYITFVDKTVQNYLLETAVSVPPKDVFTLINNEQRLIAIEIKQNKEEMEEKKQKLDDLVGLYTSAKITYKEFDEKLKTLYADKEECKSSLKEFDLEAAKSGKPVCTRDGRKARIICFDRDWDMHIVALVAGSLGEEVNYYLSNGKVDFDKQNDDDLMMLFEKKEGWVNVDKRSNGDVIISKLYPTRDEAIHNSTELTIDTVNIEWEE